MVGHFFESFRNWFWNEDAWLPPGVEPNFYGYPAFGDIIVALYFSVVFLLKPWFWETARCWYGYPFQVKVRIYYMTELSFYGSLVLSQFLDVIRKVPDNEIISIHVYVAGFLDHVHSSHYNNHVVSLLVTDDGEKASKMSRYCRQNALCNTLFSIFFVVWVATRLGIYPFRIIYSTTIEAPALVSFFVAYYTFNSLLLVLLALQLIWTYLILRIAVNTARSGEVNVDCSCLCIFLCQQQ
ncbi:TRAM LAG1 CLN8 domain containing protein [Trichuris trichiura]|uniref:TRAM LAG1 CLN8 domain containing protein n=1 Tax=Trichuris trichiura TaxID=36087 RepID=A0A077ZGM7_TRITR|nr:TRAM LAG1 CLN8 domain containing protein [Trichuris trichiura]